MPAQQAASPRIVWEEGTWHVKLPLEDGRVVDAKWKPNATYVVRIREARTEDWSFGFESPITSFTFVDLKPDTEYVFQVRHQDPLRARGLPRSSTFAPARRETAATSCPSRSTDTAGSAPANSVRYRAARRPLTCRLRALPSVRTSHSRNPRHTRRASA